PVKRQVVIEERGSMAPFVSNSEGNGLLLAQGANTSRIEIVARARIVEILGGGKSVAEVGPEAIGRLKEGQRARFAHPFEGMFSFEQPKLAQGEGFHFNPTSTKSLAALPDLIAIGPPGEKSRSEGPNPIEAARTAARRAQSTNNLKQIALAFANFEASYG